jgi:glyoxylase I family protein
VTGRPLSARARITAGPQDFDAFIHGWRMTWFADPDGNIVEISQGYVDEPDPPQP